MSDDPILAFLFLASFWLALYLVIWFYILLPAEMATRRKRSAFGWVLLSLLFSPVLACLLLWLLGANPNQRGKH
jgi:hypothetical protein